MTGAETLPSADTPGLQHVRLSFTGRVQGVGFRMTAMDIARRLGLEGWARNEWDGTVTVELQGSASSIRRFTALLEKAYGRFPLKVPMAIGSCEVLPPDTDLGSFTIRY